MPNLNDLVAAEADLKRLEAENVRLRAALTDARDALYNGFKPDNQSRAWHRANNALNEQSAENVK